MTNKGCLRPGQCKLVQVVLVACFAAFLRDHGCEAQILINNGAGIGVIPPGLRLSQTLQQGTFGFPRPGLFRSFEAPVSPAVLDATLADSSDAALGTDSAGADLATVPPPPPPPASPPPPPLAVNSTARWRRSSLPNSTSNSSAPAPAPAPVVANSTAVSFSQLIAWAAIAPAPYGHAPSLAPGPKPAGDASSAPAQSTQIQDLIGAQPPATAVSPGPPGGGGSGTDPRTESHGAHSAPQTCEAQGLTGQCNECVCCCIPAGSGGFWRYVPSNGCGCSKVVSKPDIWIALALVGILLLPAALWAAYLADALCISPYKPPVAQLLLAAGNPAAQNGH